MPNKGGVGNNGDSIDFRQFLLERFWHEGENLNERTDWFLIFQALLIEAYLSARSVGVLWGFTTYGLEIAVFGLLTSFLWLAVGVRQQWHIFYFRECLQNARVSNAEVAHVLRTLLDARRTHEPRWVSWAHSVAIFSKWIPLSCSILWLFLLFQRRLPSWKAGTLAGLVFVAMATVVFREPVIPTELIERIIPPGSESSSSTESRQNPV